MDVISSVIQDISQSIKGHVLELVPANRIADMNAALAAFVLRAEIYNPDNAYDIHQSFSRANVATLIKQCVKKINSKGSPQMETLKLQIHVDSILPYQEDMLKKQTIKNLSECNEVCEIILETRRKNLSAYENLYRNIVQFVLLKSRLGNTTNLGDVRETTVALESVFPQSELSAFINLSRNEKEAQLNGLTELVVGIRLFNKALGKGGDMIEDVSTECSRFLVQLQEDYNNLFSDCNLQAAMTEEAIRILQKPEHYDHPNLIHLPFLKSSLVFYRQLYRYLRQMDQEIKHTETLLKHLNNTFNQTIIGLKTLCKSRTAIPVEQVYPLFVELSKFWSQWRDLKYLIPVKLEVLGCMKTHFEGFSVPNDILMPSSTPENLPVEKENLEELIPTINRECTWIRDGDPFYNKDRLFVEFQNYCPVTLVLRKGLVAEGDPALGMIKYKDQIYQFANANAMKEFAKDPKRYVEGVIDIAKQMPEIIHLLQLTSYFPTAMALEKIQAFGHGALLRQRPMSLDATTQCETHIQDSFIDPKYQWNEWALRKEALLLVNLKKKQTHSTQTYQSNYKRDSETQHYPIRNSETQTQKDKSTNVAQQAFFLQGLRKHKDDKPFSVVRLELDL